MKDYRVNVKVRNNRILKAIEDIGGKPGINWCEKNGLPYLSVNDLINMTSSPLNTNGTLSKTAEKLCDVLGKIPDDLWSSEQLYPLEKNFSEMEIDYEQIVRLMPLDQQFYLSDFSGIEQDQTKKLLEIVVSKLSEREQKLIQLRYYEDKTLAECAKYFNVSVGRARQIESVALRKLRHPTMASILVKGALD